MRQHSFLSQYPMCITLVILLLGLCPIVSCSPTPFSSSTDHKNKINYDSNGFPFHPTSADDISLLSPTVQHSLSKSSPLWYVQPRTGANQFLLSHLNENEILAPKWFRNSHHDDDDSDAYASSAIFLNRRSTAGHNNGGFSHIKKRKQLNKPPMEVMNEIVNSIYLKR